MSMLIYHNFEHQPCQQQQQQQQQQHQRRQQTYRNAEQSSCHITLAPALPSKLFSNALLPDVPRSELGQIRDFVDALYYVFSNVNPNFTLEAIQINC